MYNNAMRWPGRLRGPAQGIQSLLFHDSGRAFFRRTCIHSKPAAGSRSKISPLSRGLCTSHKFQTNTKSGFSKYESASSGSVQNPTSSDQTQKSKKLGPPWTLLMVIFAASAGTAYLYRLQSRSPDDDVINTSTFSAFIVTKREQVSPSAFIIALRPSTWVDPRALESRRVEDEDDDDGATGFLSDRIQEAWRHGLWYVEIKQPQLQIARHYTPLPPVPTPADSSSFENSGANEVQVTGSDKTRQDEEQEEQTDLRILIRRMDGGEMSNYLSRQRVGDTVWLRGPHLGFDVARRLGTSEGSGHDGNTDTSDVGGQQGVVFLAGGTGIAPALQIAHRLLDANSSSDSRNSKPHISILWANRWGTDALGREQPPSTARKSGSWFELWGRKDSHSNPPLQENQVQVNEPSSSLALQIQDLKRRHGSHFQISYFVDDEGSFIKAQDLEAAFSSTSLSTGSDTNKSLRSPVGIDQNCTWHSAKAVELLPDDNDAARSASSSGTPCACTRPGANLLCVSGPDGFIAAYAGAKRWHEGNEMQSAVRGLLGKMKHEKGGKLDGWLVLKL